MRHINSQKSNSLLARCRRLARINAAALKLWTAITFVYGLSVTIYAFTHRAAFLAMTPDQFATFLAGAFAPIAFLWLIIGYHFDRAELQNTAKALRLQGVELRKSVEHQEELASLARQQLIFERECFQAEAIRRRKQAQPDFMFVGGEFTTIEDRRIMQFDLLNVGAPCSDVRLHVSSNLVIKQPLMEHGARFEVDIEIQPRHPLGDRDFLVQYTDTRGERGEETLTLTARQIGHDVHLEVQ